MQKTGFTRPFHKLQMLSWVVNAIIVLIMMVIVFPLSLVLPAQLAFVALFVITEALVVGVGLALTGTMPTDPVVIQSREDKAKHDGAEESEQPEFYCDY